MYLVFYRLRRFVPIFLVLLLTVFSLRSEAEYTKVLGPLPDDPMQTVIYQLGNGLTVYLSDYHEEPRFYAEIAARAGSKVDPPATTGLAHYLEHLLFKGTSQLGSIDYEKEKPHLDRITELYEEHFVTTDPAERKAIYEKINDASREAAAYAIPNELDRIYTAMGGTGINAHTWHEEVVFKVDLPANRLEQWAILESERFAGPILRLFQTELETVYEEMNRALDNKQFLISRAVEEVLYKEHPYGQQMTIGKPEHLKNPSLKNIQEYYETWYVPNNMAIFISGDIDLEETIKTIDAHFSAWESKKLPRLRKWREKPLEGREFVETAYEGEEYVLLAFRTAAVRHKHADALKLADMILDNATAGLINLNLNQKQLVRAAGSAPSLYNDYGAQYLWGIPKDGQSLEEVEALLLEQLELLKKGEFEEWLIPAIVNDFKKNEKAAFEQNESRVATMRSSWIALQPWEEALAQIDRMEKLTKADVVKVAKKYFGEDYVAGYRRDAPHDVPEVEKPTLATISIDPGRQSAFAQKLLAIEVEAIEPVYIEAGNDYQVKTDPRGRTLYYVANPVNDLFNLSLHVDFGTHEDNTIAPATLLLQKAGTDQYSAEDLKKEWYKLAAEFGIGAGDNETSVSLNGLDENFAASLALLDGILQHPETDEATLEELKKIILVQRADAKKQAPSIHSALVQYNRYGEQSYYLRMLPDAGIMALTQEQLFRVIQNLLGYKHSFSYTGTLPLEEVWGLLEKHFPIEGALQDPPPYRYLTARAPENTEIYLFKKEVAQANVRLEFGDLPYSPEAQPAIDLYNEYFAGGMAGVVFQELREARALAYVAAAQYVTGYREKDQNLMVGVIQTQNDKTLEAATAFLELIDTLPVSAERFENAKQSMINQYRTNRIGFRNITGAVRAWERRGITGDPRREWFPKIQESDINTILNFHQAQITGKNKLISIVGDSSKMDLEKLEQIGPIKDVTLEEIFVE